ncbi:MAG: ferritin family protein [Phycisphaerae bacterium]|nr:ferritin family protein [Phycisphaerae bacterium]
MDVEMSGYEVLEIAEKIERNGVKFYRRAAGLCDDPSISTLLVQLAQWESKHIEVFRQMRERLAAEHWKLGQIEPNRIDMPDARAMAGLAVFGIQPDPTQELTGNESKADVLRLAIEKEKDSIVYYTGLKDFVPQEIDRRTIEEVIQEEMKHVRILVQSLEQIT